nr:RNA-directed DNA polymerase, eukaryota, reverse transcriptase zinc-binding domain protein [Tanacetum cinerariifolium]
METSWTDHTATDSVTPLVPQWRGHEDGKIQNATSKLGCLVLNTPFTYLGTKVCENMSRKESWKDVVDKSELTIDTLVQVLECFYRASGLRINMCKSKIMGVNVEDEKIQNAASKLGCLVLKTPFTYPGTMVGENMSRKEAWKEVVDKSSLWTRVIKAIHGDDGKLDKDVIIGGQTCWTSIVKEARSLKGTGINVVDLILLKLGNGDSSSFWEDKWYTGDVIKELFPRLYALELHKHATVRMKLMAPSLDNSFHRRVRSGAEESQFNSLLEIVQVINLVLYEDRNKLLFDNKTPKKALIFDNLFSLSFNWCKYKCKASFKWDDWLKNPYLISV